MRVGTDASKQKKETEIESEDDTIQFLALCMKELNSMLQGSL